MYTWIYDLNNEIKEFSRIWNDQDFVCFINFLHISISASIRKLHSLQKFAQFTLLTPLHPIAATSLLNVKKVISCTLCIGQYELHDIQAHISVDIRLVVCIGFRLRTTTNIVNKWPGLASYRLTNLSNARGGMIKQRTKILNILEKITFAI